MLLAETIGLRVRTCDELTELGFCTEIRDDDTWRAASIASRPAYDLVGASATDAGLRGAGTGYTWEATFRPEASGIRVETILTVMQPVRLNPSMLLWLGALDNLEDRQAHTWRQTVLRAPTTNQQGLGGNDLPACYLYDHENRIETVVYTPPDAFAWSRRRFYNFTLREVVEYQPVARYGLGLLANSPEPRVDFSHGEHRFCFWFIQRARSTVPTPWEAQRCLLDAVAPLLDVVPDLDEDAPGWAEMAERALEDLHHPACWVNIQGVEGLRAYVRGSSLVGRDEANGFELMTQLDVLLPLLLWRDATGNTRADGIIERLLKTLPHFHRPLERFVTNGYPPRDDDTFMDTWYFLENALIKVPWVAYLTGDNSLKSMFFDALEGAGTLAANTQYLFPLFADAGDWQPRNSLLNVGVGGLYAAGRVIASQLREGNDDLREAVTALRVMSACPPHMLTHEPQQLGYAAAAARYLSRVSAGGEAHVWAERAADFVLLSLRMGYWDKDPSVPFYDPRGMFQACASLCYPAYKENVETLLAWSELLHDGAATLHIQLMAAWMNLQRCHNYAFFDPWLPQDKRQGSCAYIPYEDVATHEFDHTAMFGKELYGAGEVFWSALLFDVLGHVVDAPDILCLSLDIPCLVLRSIPHEGRRYLLYNPSDRDRKVALTHTHGEKRILIPAKSTVVEGG